MDEKIEENNFDQDNKEEVVEETMGDNLDADDVDEYGFSEDDI